MIILHVGRPVCRRLAAVLARRDRWEIPFIRGGQVRRLNDETGRFSTKGRNMSKTLSYLIVAVVAFLLGGASFWLGDALAVGSRDGIPAANPASREFLIEGMTCQGCADTVTSALKQVPGIKSAQVSLKDRRALVIADPSRVPNETILTAISQAGYQGQPATAALSAPKEARSTGKSPILVNITRGTNDLHAVSMALGLAQSALKDGRKAVVFLNVEAPQFAARNLDDKLHCPDFPPVKKLMADFIAEGGRVLVCGHCAHVLKLDKNNMIDGAKIIAHGELFDALTPGTMVFSY
jgi:copper chaperone CopZ/predicted peroxiredoxin